MAEQLIIGAILGDLVPKSSSLIIRVINKTWYFKTQLEEMRRTLDAISPIADQLDKLNEQLDRPKKETEGLAILLKQADVLVDKSANIKWKIWKRSRHASKLDNMNKSLREFVQLNINLQSSVTVAETLLEVRSLKNRGSVNVWSCGAPLQKGGVVGFDDRVTDLKAMMFKDNADDDCSIVVVSAAGGSGKTTFITMFCHDPEMQCYQDLGLFPEDQMIAATTLMDIWAHLYNHDEDGSTTMDILSTLSSKNLANLLPIRKHLSAIANHCEEEHVMQHDMMRELSIHLSSKGPLEHRERLILNSNGQDLPQSPQTVIPHKLSVSVGLFDSFSRFFGSWHTYTQTFGARILSVSIDEKFSLTWDEIQAPNVEVLVLNFMSEIHPLPRIIQTMEKLKVLIVTNYGYNFSEIQNFPAPHYLSGLKMLRNILV